MILRGNVETGHFTLWYLTPGKSDDRFSQIMLFSLALYLYFKNISFYFPYLLLLFFSGSVVSNSLPPQEPQNARPPCPSPTPGVHPNPCPSRWWFHPTISSSVIPLSSCFQSFPALGSFLMSHLFTSGDQSIGTSASAWDFPMNIRDWFPLGLTGWISLQSKGLSRVFSNTTVRKYQFLIAQPSLWANFHIHIWLLEKAIASIIPIFLGKVISLSFLMSCLAFS